ncbi:MAG: hypothetical protein AAGE65_05145 [Planctomycetota bacterium]
MRCRMLLAVAALAVGGAMAVPAAGQLRVVTYNTNTFGTEGFVPELPSSFRTVRPEADVVFQAIGEEAVNGIARPADIILLQEQQQVGSTTENLLQRLNAIYADQGIVYARGQLNPGITGDPGPGLGTGPGAFDTSEIRQGFLYRTDSVELIDESFFGGISGPTQPRATQFIQFRPVGFGPEADLFVFNVHFEAGDGLGFGDDLFARESEATDIRDFISANGLGSSNVIVAGDLNVDSNFETSGVTTFDGRSALQILADGTDESGRVLDPLFPNGELVDFQIFSPGVPNTQFGVDLGPFLTQSPSDGAGPLTGGGIDDRFDFILQSDELLDGEGVASIPGTLRSFGNNGSTPNDQINDGNTIQIAGLTSFTTAEALDALEAASDHLPVVEDFQLPATLEAELLSAVPVEVTQGDAVSLDLAIFNATDVSVAIGADELDFELTTEGDVFGAASGTDAALGEAFLASVQLNTNELGSRSGVITVTSDSPAVANGRVTIPVSFTVVPEPGVLGVLTGLGVLGLRRRVRVGELASTGSH